jgi:hypothetical protein
MGHEPIIDEPTPTAGTSSPSGDLPEVEGHEEGQRSGQLVSEADLPVDTEDIAPAGMRANEAAQQLRTKLISEGFEAEISGSGIAFDLPAGRSRRRVHVPSIAIELALSLDLRSWRSLERFDGVWNPSQEIIEVGLRTDRFLPSGRILSILGKRRRGLGEEPEAIELTDEATGLSMRIGRASEAMALLSGSRAFLGGMGVRPRGIPGPLTLTLSSVRVSGVAEADALVERLTDALAVEVGMRWGLLLVPVGLSSRKDTSERSTRLGGELKFPRSQFPHAPVALYVSGRERSTSALLRYWAFYQVLEYYFPFYSQAASMQKVRRILRAPTFDAYRDEDVLKTVAAATEVGNNRISEEEQLITCLRAITTERELREQIEKWNLAPVLLEKRGRASEKVVNISSSNDLVSDLGRRIYDIRCRIVHSKSQSDRDGSSGLLPGTHDEALVEDEIPILDFLAEQALIASASRLELP